jgi:hypothetical protein
MTVLWFTIRSSDINRCPKRSLAAEHYNEDGSCRCDEEREARMAHPVAVNTLAIRDGHILGHATTVAGALRHAQRYHHNRRIERMSVELKTVPDFISATGKEETFWQIGVHLRQKR